VTRNSRLLVHQTLFLYSTVQSKKSHCHFQKISKFIHVVENEARPAECKDRLYKVRPVVNSLVSKFQQIYVPEK
jgi:hypothetical protein